ncbi:MAG: hypothetical protein ACHQZR_09755 [Candidatus Limnocylindrales bacterium]
MTAAGVRGNTTMRRRASVVLVVITAVGIVLSSLAVWTRATLLSTDHYVQVMTDLVQNEQVVQDISDRIAAQTVVALDVQARVAAVLPDKAGFLAAPLTDRIQTSLSNGIDRILSTDQFQAIWVAANRAFHTQLLAVLRGQSSVANLENGELSIDLFAVVPLAVEQLRTAGVLPADSVLPDLSNLDLTAARQKLGAALGVTIPPDLGKIVLLDAPALQRLQTAVQALDTLVLVLVLLTVIVALAALAISPRRLRTALYLSLTAVMALALVRIATAGASNVLADALAAGGSGAIVGNAITVLLNDYRSWLFLFLIAGAVAAVVAALADRATRSGLVRPSDPQLRTLALVAVGIVVVGAIFGLDWAIFVSAGVAMWAVAHVGSTPDTAPPEPVLEDAAQAA